MAETTAFPPLEQSPSTDSTLVQRLTAECLGVAILVLVGCLTALQTDYDAVSTALAFGLTLLALTVAFARISGAHLNPAVSVASALSGRQSWRESGLYAAAQLVGGILGALVLVVLMHGFDGYGTEVGAAANSFGDEGSGYAGWAALLLEIVLTAIFVWVFLAVTDRRSTTPALAPLAIGVALTVVYFAANALTGGSVNPARSFGPALFSGGDAVLQVWVFVLGPLLGGLGAGAAYPALFGRDAAPVPGSGFSLPERAPRAATPQPAQSAQPAEPAPIIQDGWQWDPVAQQWKPAEQPPGAPQQWPDGDGRTQIR
ncbi:MAG: MIP family channel protein [Actinobacteria bacterium]|uniref:Unannotated protein n=1 Tax=freshwater metagenome TaxID=449393 RepID=A0A6J6SI71_9ZZZZ|nr:MIP family channel protein [Actinomycetota bacterium]